MPFDPRLVRPDDHDETLPAEMLDEGELLAGLPPDMVELATQLQADAAWLTSTFPAAPHKLKLPAPSTGRRRQWLAVAAALLVIVGGASWLAQRRGAPSPTITTLVTQVPDSITESPAPDLPVLLGVSPAASSGLLWQDATGPELEGLLDLLEDDSLAGNVVSL